VSVWSSAATDVVLDVSGWWSSPSGTAGGELHVLSPTQVLNTVSGSESGLCPTSTAQCATIPAGGTLEATVAGQGGVPSSGVAQVVVNVVAADTSGPGWVTAYGGDDAMPANATAIFDGTGVVSALAVVNVSATGTIKLSSVFASTDVVVEVEGWISAGASAGGTRYVPADSPARVLDTRAGTRAGACPAATVECTSLSGGPRTVQIAGQGPVPAGVSSVLASVTVFGAASVGVLQAYPAGGSAPGGLSMVFNGGVPVTQLVALALNADGQVELLSPFTAIDVTIDVVGWNVAATDTWAYGYNPDGLRASKTPPAGSGIGATTFTWDRASGLPMLLAQDQAGVGVTNYLYGPDGLAFEQINPDGTTLWLHHDQLGSTRLVTNAAGTTVGSLTYDAYGNTASSSGTVSNIRLRFAGEYLDSESGLYYLRNRFYDPGTGQFLTRDPLVGATRSAYGYAGHDPLNAIDPSGLSVGPESWWDAEAQVANFAGGLLDSVTLGNGKRILNAVGQGDKVDACSGWFTAGERTGLVIQLAFAVAELKGATAAAEAPRSAPDFVAGPIGSGPPVPVSQSRMAAGFDAAGFPSTRTVSAGVEYTLPDGSLVRLMQPSGEAPLRASFTNANGGYINPFTGKPVQPPAPSGWSMKDWVRALAHVGQTP
jgi:RHS repeat-associated protein